MARVLVKDVTTQLSTDIGIVTIPGEVKAYAGATAPTGFLFCHGQAVSRTTYSALYAVLGNSHGQGDGSTTFNLPDYRGSFLRGRVNINTVSGSGTAVSNQATFTGHDINRTGFKVRLSSGTLTGLSLSVDYFVIVIDANTLAFATSQANALANTRVVISGVNSAVLTQFEDPDASSRLAMSTGGNSGNSLGASQEDTFKAHLHRVGAQDSTAGFGGGFQREFIANFGSAGGPASNSETVGDNETRPKNALINYIIKF